MPDWLDWLIEALAGVAESFSGMVGEPLTGCERRPVIPTVTVEGRKNVCMGSSVRLRASGSPWEYDGIYRWDILEGHGTLSDDRGAAIELTPKKGGRIRVGVTYTREYVSSERVEHSVTVHTRKGDIPKLIHFIWAGGTRIMTEPSFRTVAAWANANRDYCFGVIIWVDKISHPDVEEAYKEKYGITFDSQPIFLRDITDENVSSPLVRYEIDKLWPNYGSSSDLLRYAILYQIGGAYFDSDVHPGKTPLNEDGLFDTGGNSVFLCSDNSQNSSSIGNDTFICTSRHDFMSDILHVSESHYRGLGYGQQRDIASWFDDNELRRVTTVERTGPTAVARGLKISGVLKKVAELDADSADLANLSRPLRLEDGYYRNQLPDENRIPPEFVHVDAEETNTLGWMNVPIRKTKSPKEAVRIAAETMRFEIEEFGLLREIDHVSEIAVAAGIDLPNKSRLEGYKSEIYAVNRKSEVSEEEAQIAGALRETLGKVNLKRVIDRLKKNALIEEKARREHPVEINLKTFEPECRYKEFADLYREIGVID